MAEKDWDRPLEYRCDGCGATALGIVPGSMKTSLMPPGWRRRLVKDNIMRACSADCEKLVDAQVD
jgi:hypothetical protein